MILSISQVVFFLFIWDFAIMNESEQWVDNDECRPVSSVMYQQILVVSGVLLSILLIGVLGLVGIYTRHSALYSWAGRKMVLTGSESFALMGLAIGVATFIGARSFCRKGLIWVARACFLGTLGLGLSELWAYLSAPESLPIERFLIPQSPLSGHIPIYSAVGFSLIGLVFLLASFFGQRKPGLQWGVQVLGIVLMSLGLVSLFEYVGHPPSFHYLGSIPLSVGFFLCGVALLFLPLENQLLATPFFSQPINRLYAWLLLGFWVCLIGWQSFLGDQYITSGHILTSHEYFLAALNDVVITLMSSLILAFGLNLLYVLTERDKLAANLEASAQKVRASLDGVALLASTLSHDLKAPIINQMKALEMLGSGRYGREISTPGNQEMLSAILDNNQFELDLVLNLINLLRYKIQDAHFDPHPIALPGFLAEIGKELAPLALRKDQHLEIETTLPEETTVVADPLALKRVVHNLMNNAIMHLSEGHHIGLEAQIRDGDFLFRVKDDGPGIPPERQLTLFTRLNRISSSGLGLYISRQIVERHGGRIWVESAEGQGTSFYFTIPRTPVIDKAGQESAPLAVAVGPVDGRIGS